MKSVEANEGQDVEYKVKLAGNPKPDVKFLKELKTLKEDQNHIVKQDGDEYSLTIKNVKSSDTGTYSCCATNDYGTQSSQADLSIKIKQIKPSFTKKMQDYEAKDGDEMIEFNIKVEGSPTPNIKWFHGEDQLKSPEYKFVDDGNSHTLIIPKVTAEKSGKYTCEASNTEGKIQSSGTLTVNAAPVFIKKLEDRTANKDQDVKLSVTLAGHPSPQLKWFKDNQEIKIDNKHFKSLDEDSNKFTLIINKVDESDGGLYKVEASNVFGKSDSSANLKINLQEITSKPAFIKGLRDIEVNENETVSLDIKVSGNPTEVSLFKDGKDISAEATVTIKQTSNEDYIIVIEKIKYIMAGEYQCKIANKYGHDVSKGRVSVKRKSVEEKAAKDSIITQNLPSSINVVTGQPLKLDAKVEGSPSPDVEWLKDGIPIKPSENIIIEKKPDGTVSLEIKQAQPGDSGKYELKATSPKGQSVSSSDVKVGGKHHLMIIFK